MGAQFSARQEPRGTESGTSSGFQDTFVVKTLQNKRVYEARQRDHGRVEDRREIGAAQRDEPSWRASQNSRLRRAHRIHFVNPRVSVGIHPLHANREFTRVVTIRDAHFDLERLGTALGSEGTRQRTRLESG